ncbi:MAG: hypothetical protein R2911_05895 [Caldilineaceae bacterium]
MTPVGMFGASALCRPAHQRDSHQAAVGSIVKRPALMEGEWEEREHLCHNPLV